MKNLLFITILTLVLACSKEQPVFEGQSKALQKAKQVEQKVLNAADAQKKLLEKQMQQ